MKYQRATIEFHGAHVMIEWDDNDPDVLPFVTVAANGAMELYTAAELKELAEKMDVWQTMNMKEEEA